MLSQRCQQFVFTNLAQVGTEPVTPSAHNANLMKGFDLGVIRTEHFL